MLIFPEASSATSNVNVALSSSHASLPRGTTRPRERLLQHRRSPPAGVRNTLRSQGRTTADLLYHPLAIVPASELDNSEFYWTIRVHPGSSRGMNGFATDANPARTRRFWSRGPPNARPTARPRPPDTYNVILRNIRPPLPPTTLPRRHACISIEDASSSD
jgi:hypothetical protein